MACFGRRRRRNCALDNYYDVPMRIVSNTNVSGATDNNCTCCCCCNNCCGNVGGTQDSCVCGPCYYVTNADCDCSDVQDTYDCGCGCGN